MFRKIYKYKLSLALNNENFLVKKENRAIKSSSSNLELYATSKQI